MSTCSRVVNSIHNPVSKVFWQAVLLVFHLSHVVVEVSILQHIFFYYQPVELFILLSATVFVSEIGNLFITFPGLHFLYVGIFFLLDFQVEHFVTHIQVVKYIYRIRVWTAAMIGLDFRTNV